MKKIIIIFLIFSQTISKAADVEQKTADEVAEDQIEDGGKMKKYSELTQEDKDGLLCWHITNLNVVEKLLKANANVNHISVYAGFTPLMIIIKDERYKEDEKIEIVKKLLEYKPDVNQFNVYRTYPNLKWNPLILATSYGYTNIVELLINAQADVNFVGRDGNTSLHWAIIKGNPDRTSRTDEFLNIIEQLLDAQADVSIKNDSGFVFFDYIEDWCQYDQDPENAPHKCALLEIIKARPKVNEAYQEYLMKDWVVVDGDSKP